jgi:hypothetical protein
MREYCDCESINLEILIDLHFFHPLPPLIVKN